jgi:hypothetical protein
LVITVTKCILCLAVSTIANAIPIVYGSTIVNAYALTAQTPITATVASVTATISSLVVVNQQYDGISP